jgi:predicted outer membrane repeat protein
MPPLNNFTRSCLAIAISQAVAAPALAASIVVNDNGDAGTGDTCTLRQAIVSANTNNADASNCTVGNVATDTITFENSGTTTLTSSLPLITTDMSIIGNANGSTIDANSTGRVFNIGGGAAGSLSLNNLTISGGSASSGGAIHNGAYSSVSVSNSTISGNSATSLYGGAMHFAAFSKASLSNSTISGNYAAGIGGGAISSSYTELSLSNTTVRDNSAAGNGGAIYLFGFSSLSLSNSTISGNSAGTKGGAIYVSGSTLSLSNSTLSDNSAGTNGGALFTTGSELNLSNSTVSGNSAASNGGAIYTISSIVSLNNSIVSGNRAETAAETANEITGNDTEFTTAHNLFGDSANYNLVAISGFTPDVTDITATGDGSQPTPLSAILAPLADNGGATQTHALVEGSPAIDSGDDTLCAAEPVNNLDQRGTLRPVGDACDIGAYEAEAEAEAEDDSSLFVVPLANGKVAVFEF